MEAVQKDHWYLMVLLIFLLLLRVGVQQRGSVTRLEERMVLDCLCPWNATLIMVSWTKQSEKTPLVVFHPHLGTEVSQPYQGRVDFLKRTPLDGSIAISNSSRQDLGLYRCYVNTFPLGSWTTDVQVVLEDAEEPVAPPTEAAPPPESGSEAVEADSELVAERSDSLTIGCNHQHNGSVYRVTVEKLGGGGGGGAAAILAVCRVADGGVPVGEGFTQRGRVNCTDRLDVSLHLADVVEEDGGFYRCRFHTDAGVRTTTVLLTVPSPVESSLSEYMIYIYMGSGVAGCVLLFGVVTLVALHRKKRRRKEYRVKLHPAHRRPRNYYENVLVNDKRGRKVKHIGDSPVYANIQSTRLQAKRKR